MLNVNNKNILCFMFSRDAYAKDPSSALEWQQRYVERKIIYHTPGAAALCWLLLTVLFTYV